jgi:hypothetical protein
MAKYKAENSGRWIQPIKKGYKMMCCDCGLVHLIDFRFYHRRIQFRVDRDNRATGQARRWMKRNPSMLDG